MHGPVSLTFFSIAIQIRRKFRFTLASILIEWPLQNFVHGTTAMLSWRAKICCDLMARNGVMARRNFHWIRNAGPASGSENPKSKAPHSTENNRNHQQYSLYLVLKSCRNHEFIAIPLCEPPAIPSGIAPQSWSRCHSVVAQLAAGRLILF